MIMMPVELPLFSGLAQNDVFILVIFCGNNSRIAVCRSVLQQLVLQIAGVVASLHTYDLESDKIITTQFNNG